MFWGLAVSAGVGVPVRLDKPTVGVRFQGGLQVPVVSLLVAMDLFPSLPKREQTVASVLVQLSL